MSEELHTGVVAAGAGDAPAEVAGAGTGASAAPPARPAAGAGGHVGSIDLLKFLLALAIIIDHAGRAFIGGTSYPLQNGGIACEVFFVISGCLLCASAERDEARSTRSLGEDTASFIWRKVKGILVPYLVTIVIYLVCWCEVHVGDLMAEGGVNEVLKGLFRLIPNLLLTSMAGIMQGTRLIDLTWYLSAMLLSMLVIYPLVRKLGGTYTKVVAPFCALMLMGYMYNMGGGGYKGIIDDYLGFMTHGLMRAFIGINWGCVAFELARSLAALDLTGLARGLLTCAVVLLCAVTVWVMACGGAEESYALVLLLPLLVGILYSRQMAGSALFDNRVCAYLGRSSMHLYLYHAAVRRVLVVFFPDVGYAAGLAIMLAGAFLMFVATDLVERACRRAVAASGFRLRDLFVKSAE